MSADARLVALQSIGFVVPLGQLQAGDYPKYPAKRLGFASKEVQVHSPSSETQIGGIQAPLEVFDRVCQVGASAYGTLTQYRSWGIVPLIAARLISKRFRQLCGLNTVVPVSYTAPRERISIAGEFPIASSGFSDAWRGSQTGRTSRCGDSCSALSIEPFS